MKYSVHVPLGRPLQFPDQCPFSDTPSPNSTVKLIKNSTSLVLPLPGGFNNSYSKTSFCIPASRKIAVLSVVLKLMIWMSILGGVSISCWLVSHHSYRASGALGIAPVLFLFGGPVLAIAFRIIRYFVLRRVRIQNAWNGFVEVVFQSENYAREFSERNKLALIAD